MESGDARRERLAVTFERASEQYQQARPDYPEALFDHLLEATGLEAGARILEIGCATGKATLPLARRGLRVTALEPGSALAAEARRNLEGFAVSVVEDRFEDWLPSGPPFDAVVAATAWHWIDPRVGYRKAAEVLGPGGWLALWTATHIIPYDGDPFFDELQPVYDEIGEGLPPDTVTPRPGELPDQRHDIEADGWFEVVDLAQYDWETRYDADGYIALLDTFSGHIAMEAWQRERLYGEIRRRLAARDDGVLRRHWGALLHIARRLEA